MSTELVDKILNSEIDSILPQVIGIRRKLHQNPELSGSEFKTAELIYQNLKNIGLKPSYHLNKTAVSATIYNGSKKTVVLRADTDALPIQEQTGLSFASQKKGIMHACGHDMHTAILFGAASVLNKIKDRWKGSIVLLFQPSEEVEPGGASELINAGIFPEKADAVFGLHVSTDHKTGTIGIKKGIDYAGITTFDIKIIGKGGHGGTPEKTIDPVVCISSIVTQLQTIISREIPRFTPATLTIGSLHAGNIRNIIPDDALLQGTIRSHSDECMKFIMKRIKDMTYATANSFRADAQITFNSSYPPSFNDPDLVNKFAESFSSLSGTQNVIKRDTPIMYAEDFAYYQKLVPGIFVHLGIVDNKRKSTSFGLHNSKFIPDENAIKTGIAAHIAFSVKILGE